MHSSKTAGTVRACVRGLRTTHAMHRSTRCRLIARPRPQAHGECICSRACKRRTHCVSCAHAQVRVRLTRNGRVAAARAARLPRRALRALFAAQEWASPRKLHRVPLPPTTHAHSLTQTAPTRAAAQWLASTSSSIVLFSVRGGAGTAAPPVRGGSGASRRCPAGVRAPARLGCGHKLRRGRVVRVSVCAEVGLPKRTARTLWFEARRLVGAKEVPYVPVGVPRCATVACVRAFARARA